VIQRLGLHRLHGSQAALLDAQVNVLLALGGGRES
jgi:hypothetical protein